MKVITFSKYFPAHHPRKGEETLFMEKIWKGLDTGNRRDGEYSVWANLPRLMKDGHWQLPHLWRDKMLDKRFYPKYHTIRAGKRWKAGDIFSPRIWSGLPYRSKQIEFAPPIEVKKIWDVVIERGIEFRDDMQITVCEPQYNFKPNFRKYISDSGNILIAKNDGLSVDDFNSWFNKDVFEGQIICWDEKVNY